MNRNIDYIIDEDSAGLRVEQFLRRKRYSGQNLSEIKRMPKSILVNGVHYYMRQELSTGDHLQVRICETKNSEKIPPTNLPLDIIYEDEDILVVNKPKGKCQKYRQINCKDQNSNRIDGFSFCNAPDHSTCL